MEGLAHLSISSHLSQRHAHEHMSWRVHMLNEESWLLPAHRHSRDLLAVSRLAKGYRRRTFVIVGYNASSAGLGRQVSPQLSYPVVNH